MPIAISVGSGKGGAGKSVLSTNISYLLGRSGLSATLADLDSGGADINILMGLFKPRYTLTGFIEKKLESLEQVALKLEGLNKIRVITGTGNSLHTANTPSATRSKLLRHVQKINSDIVNGRFVRSISGITAENFESNCRQLLRLPARLYHQFPPHYSLHYQSD